MGIISPDSTYDARLGFNFKLQFIPNTQNYVITDPANVFEAVSIKDNSVSRADCVEFTPIEQTAADKKEGIYYAYAKVTKAADDIRIRPKCALVPKITSVWPPNDNTSYPQDSSIKVSFNKPINLSDFADEDGQLENITIKTGDTDLLDTTGGKQPYYKLPYLEDDGKILVIPIAKGNYIITNESSPAKDIDITINLAGLTDGVEAENVAFNQTEYKFQYRVDSRKDSNNPVFNTLRIARTAEDVLNINGPNIFQDYDNEDSNITNPNSFAYYAKKINFGSDECKVENNIRNHHVNKIWFFFDSEDIDSGIDKLVVEERLVYTKEAESESGELYISEYRNELNKNAFSSYYEYIFQTPIDGVINLNFKIYDYSGKVVQKSIDLVKDTSCALESLLDTSSNDYYVGQNNSIPVHIKIKPCLWNQKPSDATFFVKDIDGKTYYESPYVKNENDSFEYSVRLTKIEYGYTSDNLTTIYPKDLTCYLQQVSNIGANLGYGKFYEGNISFDGTKVLYIYLTTEDYLGNAYIQESIIKKPMSFASWSEKTISGQKWWIISPEIVHYNSQINSYASDYYYYVSYVYENRQGEKSPVTLLISSGYGNRSIYSISNVTIDNLPDGIYYFYAHQSADLKRYGKPAVFYKNVTPPTATTLTMNDRPTFSVSADEPVKNAKKRHVSIKLDENQSLNPNLKYILEYKKTTEDENYYKALECYEFDIRTTYCSYDFRFKVCNENGECIYTDSQPLDLTYDNVAPCKKDVKKLCFSNEWFLFLEYDDEGGVGFEKNNKDEIKVKYLMSSSELKSNTIDWDNDERVQTGYLDSFYGLKLNYDGGNGKYVYVQIFDINGNYTVYNTHVREYKPAEPSLEKENDGSFTVTNISVDPNNTSGTKLTDFYLDGDKWTLTEEIYYITDENDEEIPRTSLIYCCINNYYHTYKISLTDEEKNSFIKVICHYLAENYDGYLCYSDYPLYFYPPSYAVGFTCNLKSYLECADNEIAVFTDKPCLVQTFYCTNNLGNDKTQWISYAIEAKVQQKPESFTYKVPVEEIPTGKYYVTVIHYADGTVKMTPVKQK